MNNKKFYLPIFLFVSCFIFNSCSTDVIESSDPKVNMEDFNLSIKYDKIIIGETSPGNFDYFYDDELTRTIHFSKNLMKSSKKPFLVTEIADDHIRISNPENAEQYFDMFNISQLSNKIEFDVIDNLGNQFNDFEVYQGFQSKSVPVCPWCWVVIPVAGIVESIIDASNDSDCVEGIKACERAGGLPSTEIDESIFGDSCKVTCNPKPSDD